MDAMTVQGHGRHVLLDLGGASGLDDPERVRQALIGAAAAAGATVVSVRMHRFSPQGVSGVALLAESHISAHTWPETGYGAFDIYTCGDCDPRAGATFLAEFFKATRVSLRELERVMPTGPANA